MTDIMSNNANPYGLRAIREIKGSKTKVPSERLTKKINDTHNYFYEKVDPIIGECITYLLCEKPSDVATSMLDYLQKKKEGIVLATDVVESSKSKTKAKKELKLYLAVSIGPVIAKIVNRIAVTQPENVVDFVCEELVSMISSSEHKPDIENEALEHMTAAQSGSSSHSSSNNSSTNADAKAAVTVGAEADKASAEVKEVKEKRQFQIQVLGTGGCGKSSIISSVQGQFESILRIKPTSGLRPSTAQLDEYTVVKFYDLGGQANFRGIWQSYNWDAYGLIYVVDASASQDAIAESKEWLYKTIGDENQVMAGKPVLILANKQDVDGAMSAEAISAFFELDKLRKNREIFCEPCTAHVPPDFDPETFQPDPRIEESIEKLFSSVLNNYTELNKKVSQDTITKDKMDQQKRRDREAKVLKSKIATAFIKELDPEIIKALDVLEEKESIFTEEEGTTFLAAEIGEELANLPKVALAVARGAGYQRLALQILGAMRAPISKKKTPMSWEEILELVKTIRKDLGLTNDIM